jgi:hypothetical protein
MMSDEAAHILFKNDIPKSQQPPVAGGSVPTVTVPEAGKAAEPTLPAGPAGPADAAKPDAAKLFLTEASAAERGSAVERLDTLAEAVRLGGDAERAEALIEAGSMLAAEAQAHGMPSSELQEMVGHLHEASSTLSPMTADQLADGMAKGMAELADVPATDLDLARGLIRRMSEKMPSLPYQLEATGLGNRPDFIRAVIREARRRGHGR